MFPCPEDLSHPELFGVEIKGIPGELVLFITEQVLICSGRAVLELSALTLLGDGPREESGSALRWPC